MKSWIRSSGKWDAERCSRAPRLAAALLFMLGVSMPVALNSEQCLPAVNRYYGYSFMHPLMIEPRQPGAAHVLGFDELYRRFGRQEKEQADENIREWRERYCDIPKEEDIRTVVYGYSINDLLELSAAMTVKGATMDPLLRQNSFSRYLIRHKCIETIDYLLFAKDCEPYVTRRTDAWANPDQSYRQMEMDNLIERGRKFFMQTQSDYIRLRYAFQIIRLAHYSKQYERTLELFDELMPMIDHDPSVIEYWILGHKAGALQALGRNAEAAYLYARVFLNSPGKRESAYQSFRINTDQEWEQAMLLCRDDRERATLYAMRAYTRDSKPLEDMEQIYRLDPQSPYLEVLLAREIRRFEKQLLGLEFNTRRAENRRYHGIPAKGIQNEIIDLQRFVRKVNAENQTSNPTLWLLGQGYLELIAGDAYAALKNFTRAREICKDKILLEQLDVLDAAATIASFRAPTPEVEERAAAIKLDNPLFPKYGSFPFFLNDKMRWLYQRYQRPGKAFLVRSPLRDLTVNPQIEMIDDLILLAQQGEINRFERDLLRKTDNSNLEKEMINLKATYLMAQGMLDSALTEFKKMDRIEWDNFGLFNPFIERYKECVHCPVTADTSALLNRGELIEKLLDLEYQAQANRLEGPKFFYQLGLAYYNMSYFGYAWNTTDFFRSGASLKRSKSATDPNVVIDSRFSLGNRENFDCRRALECFELARKLTDNPQLAARATFMAARCEQNLYFAGLAPRTYHYFELLKTQYAETQFYAFIIQECKYFSAYARK